MSKEEWNANKDLLDSYKLYFPSFYYDTIDVQQADAWTLFILLEDGSRYLYYYDDHTIRRLPRNPDKLTEEECRKEFSRRMSRVMLYKGITQQILSDRTGIPQSRISDYMTGKRSPSFYNVDKIAKALGCSMDKLRYI